MSRFELAIDQLLSDEGNVFEGEDNGRGASKWGITLLTYLEFYPHATADDIRALTRENAVAFYRMAFWDRYHFGLIEDQALATKLLDLGANIGGTTVIKLLQRGISVPVDGIIGPKTASVANTVPTLALAQLKAEAQEYHRQEVEKHPEWAKDLNGWLIRDRR